MKKIELTMANIDTINAIIKAHSITTLVTIEETENCGIGTVVTMSWDTFHKGYDTKMTIIVDDERNW
jgi:hypothetical protein